MFHTDQNEHFFMHLAICYTFNNEGVGNVMCLCEILFQNAWDSVLKSFCKFCWLKKNIRKEKKQVAFKEIFLMLQKAFREDCLNYLQCHEWYQRFILQGTSTHDDLKFECLSTTVNGHIVKVHTVTCKSCCLTTCKAFKTV